MLPAFQRIWPKRLENNNPETLSLVCVLSGLWRGPEGHPSPPGPALVTALVTAGLWLSWSFSCGEFPPLLARTAPGSVWCEPGQGWEGRRGSLRGIWGFSCRAGLGEHGHGHSCWLCLPRGWAGLSCRRFGASTGRKAFFWHKGERKSHCAQSWLGFFPSTACVLTLLLQEGDPVGTATAASLVCVLAAPRAHRGKVWLFPEIRGTS